MFKTGHEESMKKNPRLKFSNQNWGETSACYAKSIQQFSKTKLEEIVIAACVYCATQKGHSITQANAKGKSNMMDLTDVQGRIMPSSDIEQSDDDNECEVLEGKDNLMCIYL